MEGTPVLLLHARLQIQVLPRIDLQATSDASDQLGAGMKYLSSIRALCAVSGSVTSSTTIQRKKEYKRKSNYTNRLVGDDW